MGLHHDKEANARTDRRFDRLIEIDRRLSEANREFLRLSKVEARLEEIRESLDADLRGGVEEPRRAQLYDARERVCTQIHRLQHQLRELDQEIQARRHERVRIVRENEADSWRAEGGQWHGKGQVLSLCEYRNRMRFKVRLTPPLARRSDAA